MIVEHLTILGTSALRDTRDILPQTIEHFSHLQSLPKLSKIAQTPFSVKLTVENDIALFDVIKGDDLLFLNICCFSKADTEPAMLYAKDVLKNLPFFKNSIIRQPSQPYWIFTIPINVFAVSQEDASLAGEIEFYIWNAIRLGLKK